MVPLLNAKIKKMYSIAVKLIFSWVVEAALLLLELREALPQPNAHFKLTTFALR